MALNDVLDVARSISTAKHSKVIFAVIMIAQHKMSGDGKSCKPLSKRLVDAHFAALGEISGDRTEARIADSRMARIRT